MKIAGFQKLTLLDYPSKVACIIFTQGCNLRCPYCHNSGLIPLDSDDLIDEEEIFSYLNKRKGVIDGLVISGGEPTLQQDLTIFMKRVKSLGFLVKLDTNGCNPDLLKYIIDEGLADYIAMDIKYILSSYKTVAGVNPLESKLLRSIELLKNSSIDHEFRTTLIKNIHTMDVIEKICSYVDGNNMYLQKFIQSENVLDKKLESFSDEEFKKIYKVMKGKYPNVRVRGI